MRWNALLAALSASWGVIAVLVAAVDLDAPALAFARLAIAAGVLVLVAIANGRAAALRPGAYLPALVVLGVLQGAHWVLFFVAVKEGSVALAVLTFYTAPVLIAAVAPALLGDRVSRVALIALVPGFAGVALVATGGADGEIGADAVAAGLGSAVTYAALVIVSKRLVRRDVHPLTVAFWDCLVGAAAVAPLLVLAERLVPQGTDEWAGVLVLGAVFTGLSTLAFTWLLRRVSAYAAGVLTFLEPVTAVLLAAALVGEPLTAAVVGGGALVLGAGLAVVVLEPAEVAVTEGAAAVGSVEP
jgi:RarD protein